MSSCHDLVPPVHQRLCGIFLLSLHYYLYFDEKFSENLIIQNTKLLHQWFCLRQNAKYIQIFIILLYFYYLV